jgi:glycosyltransferase involved in cell wall biosynthesis
VKATVAICSYNRAAMLALSVPAACEQRTAFDYEVLVVDNNSSDGTGEVLARLQPRHPRLRCVVEPRQGLSHARNRALDEARGEIVAFTDDDGVARDGWLAGLVGGFCAPDVGCVAGRIVLDLPADAPEWLTPALHPFLAAFDRGPEPADVEEAYGCNFAVRRSLARQLGGFAVDLGFKGGALLPGEDTDLTRRILLAGRRIRYAPSAVVLHMFDRSRLCREWFLKRHRQQGRAEVLIGTAPSGPADIRNTARELADTEIVAARYGRRGDAVARFHALLRAEHLRGRLEELLPRLSPARRLGLRLSVLPRKAAARILAFGRDPDRGRRDGGP